MDYLSNNDESLSLPHLPAKILCRKESMRESILKQAMDHFNGSKANPMVGSKEICTGERINV